MDLCKDLMLTVIREDDPQEEGKERIRIILSDPLEMLQVEQTLQINQSTMESRRYHAREAVILVLRRVMSEAFKQGLILENPGGWKISKPTPSFPTEIEMDSTDSSLWSTE